MADPSITLPSHIDLTQIGDRIRAVREQAGLNQQVFADRLGFSRRQIIAWETAANAPPVALLKAIRQLFDIDPEWVLTGPGDVPLVDVDPEIRGRRQRLAKEVEIMVREAGLILPPESLQDVIDLMECASPAAEGDAKSAVRKMLRRISFNRGTS